MSAQKIEPLHELFDTVLARNLASGERGLPRLPGRQLAAEAYRTTARAATPERHVALVARQIMSTAPRTGSPGQSIREAGRLLRRLGVRHLPVVREDGVLAGIVSDRDLLKVSANGSLEGPEGDPLLETVMTRKVYTATPETPIRVLSEIMLKAGVSALPIIGHDSQLLGIVTSSDVLRAVAVSPVELWA